MAHASVEHATACSPCGMANLPVPDRSNGSFMPLNSIIVSRARSFAGSAVKSVSYRSGW